MQLCSVIVLLLILGLSLGFTMKYAIYSTELNTNQQKEILYKESASIQANVYAILFFNFQIILAIPLTIYKRTNFNIVTNILYSVVCFLPRFICSLVQLVSNT